MLPNLKRTITALVGVASITALVLLALFMMRRPTLTPAVEMSQLPSQEIVNVPFGPGMDEFSRALPTADTDGSQLPGRRAVAPSHKLDTMRDPQEALSTVAVEDNKGSESLVPQNAAFDSASHADNTADGVVPSREALENREAAVREPSDKQSVIASSPASPSAAAGDRVSKYLSGRASELLAEIQSEGAGLTLHAETLGTFSRNSQFNWQSHAHYLHRVKGHINAVGERTAELQRIRYAVLPWQQQAITDVTAHAAQVAASTSAAIVHLRENQNRLFVTEYREHLTAIADRSEVMKQTVDKFLDYEKTQQRFQRLQNELELAGD
jgi:hypothetical protein